MSKFIQPHMYMEDHRTWGTQCVGQKANSCWQRSTCQGFLFEGNIYKVQGECQ
jgi:hypothetical protein